MRTMILMKQAMKVHEDRCDKSDLMCNINKKKESIPNPSYSIMHTLEDFFSIMINSGTHDTRIFNGYVYRNNDVKLILNKGMGAM